MGGALDQLGVSLPVLAAPMAGGPGTAELIIAAAQVGSLGFVAAGYLTPEDLSERIKAVRAAGVRFGVNLFAPGPLPPDRAEFARYAAAIQPEGDRYGLDLAGAQPVEDDDRWEAKLDLLRADPVPLVSFTFSLPPAAVLAALRRAGTMVAQTVTSADEARAAHEAGADVLVAQSGEAGGHWGTLTPCQPPPLIPAAQLAAEVRAVTDRPVIAAGGIGSAADVARALAAGADAVAVGTVLLRSEESGATALHQEALADPERTGTVLTRAFTGRPARALRNEFTDRYDQAAPLAYPALHHLTRPLRQAATAAGDPERINLWAGTGYRHAAAAPAGRILAGLARDA